MPPVPVEPPVARGAPPLPVIPPLPLEPPVEVAPPVPGAPPVPVRPPEPGAPPLAVVGGAPPEVLELLLQPTRVKMHEEASTRVELRRFMNDSC